MRISKIKKSQNEKGIGFSVLGFIQRFHGGENGVNANRNKNLFHFLFLNEVCAISVIKEA